MPREIVIDEYVELAKAFFDEAEAEIRQRRPGRRGPRRAPEGLDVMAAVDVAGEFETIATTVRAPGPSGVGQGADGRRRRRCPSRPGYDLVLTKDAIVEGVHFLPDDPLDTVAQKLLRVNLSDLAAKGAEPFGYLLACHWSERCGWPEREAFADGLATDQAEFGDRICWAATRWSTPGPASLFR